ncbi:hypothetical protein SAMN04487968_1208 [Nocardioides terrae]|uniref:Uncharacterized protein n=1 Tax=Nocardioides terrae TaxID=574651 RepID=A0A1I1NRW1_9ACTN|nr:GNAT family N-acetyltransferase [Nocardioides terrae]SFD00404.1 hypothetical protein SAMN04487968_1208 [Nocardioides terrae]
MERDQAVVEIRKDEVARLYEALIDGHVVGDLAYETTGGRVSLTHSYVDLDQRHRGVASALAKYALEDVRAGGGRAGIYCGFVADYVDAHPEWTDVVDVNRSSLVASRTARRLESGR